MKTDTKNGLFQRIPQFFGEVRQEVKKVSWPSRRETVLTATIVFVLAIIASIYLTLVDQVIYRALHWIIG